MQPTCKVLERLNECVKLIIVIRGGSLSPLNLTTYTIRQSSSKASSFAPRNRRHKLLCTEKSPPAGSLARLLQLYKSLPIRRYR